MRAVCTAEKNSPAEAAEKFQNLLSHEYTRMNTNKKIKSKSKNGLTTPATPVVAYPSLYIV
jgi:hypothetical protein